MTDQRQKYEHEDLSPQGLVRREAMLHQLVGEVSRVRRRRHFHRAALSSTAVVLVLFGVFRYANFEPALRVTTPDQGVSQPTHSPQRDASLVVYVSTDPSAMERFRADPAPVIVQINDSQLIEILVEVGRPAGLIHFGERLALSAPVTDKELGLNQSDREKKEK